jgi:glycogen debranching enzyme
VTGRNGKSLRVIDAVAQATGWLWRRLSTSPSGLLESVPAQPRSIENQVWKDSGDSYHHLDRSLATRGTIASVEVIGLCYDALLGAAVLAKGHKASWSAKTPELLARAAALQMVLPRLVCSDSEGFYVALGFDRDTSGAQRLIGARTSNPGRLLASAILSSSAPTTACALSPAERTDLARLVARGVLSPSMRSTAGVRTLSASSSRYRPSAYHNGSVWPFDTMAIAVGLADHGIETGARELARGVVETCEANRCYPEFVNGETGQLSTRRVFVSGREGRNCIEQPPQLLQAWTVSAYFVAQHLLGSGPGDIASV